MLLRCRWELWCELRMQINSWHGRNHADHQIAVGDGMFSNFLRQSAGINDLIALDE